MLSRSVKGFLCLVPVMAASLGLAGCGRSDLDFDDLVLADGGTKKDGGDSGVDGGKSCTTAAQCDDGVACTQDFCANGQCTNKPTDGDNDGFASIGCGGKDCDDTNPDVHPGARELCTGGKDDDCNGLIDCADSTCTGQPGCACGPVEICGNKIDDNCNGTTDCADPTCKNAQGCNCGPVEICGNKLDDDCNGKTDCDDAKCATTQACSCNNPESCDNGRDDNCDGKFDCADSACATTAACTCRSRLEDCDNKIDDNCNGLVDCADPACRGNRVCSCNGRAPQPENCSNLQDDDCDGKVDCADSACITSPACSQCTTENCSNGKDDSCDGTIDCADPACVFAPNCRPTAEVCNNGVDDDRNGQIDCFDVACRSNPLCQSTHSNCNVPLLISASGTYTGDTTGFIGESNGSCGGAAGEAAFYIVVTQPTKLHLDTRGSNFDSTLYIRTGACRAGREIACDDDSGNSRNSAAIDIPILYPGTYYIFVDGFTIDATRGPDQGRYALNVELTANPREICGNGLDDDGDRFVDCADPDCASVGACLNCNGGRPPTAEFGVGACTDGKDNDCDGKVDCADSDCKASDYYVTECCNGRDENGNGIVDDFSCRCASNADCGPGNICYTKTAYACGPRCTGFNGDVCPFVASGSACSATDGQCVFPPN